MAALDPVATLRLEAAAVLDAADRLDLAAFERVVELLGSCGGKVIVTGAGTSGVIARKLAATLTSTGTPSVFMHPADALHGGLGLVATGDVVVVISNGGETPEILALIPYVRARGCPVVSILGYADSSLGRASTEVIDAHVEREACPLDLAPTSSTTVAMALGDAIAIALLERRGLTADAFAYNHPSGRLGRRLTLTVGDLLAARSGDCCVSPTDQLLVAVSRITDAGVGAVLVVERSELVGILTDGDVRRHLLSSEEPDLRLSVDRVMTRHPVFVTEDTLAIEALTTMEDRPTQISVLPVLASDGSPLGIIRLHDIVRAGL